MWQEVESTARSASSWTNQDTITVVSVAIAGLSVLISAAVSIHNARTARRTGLQDRQDHRRFAALDRERQLLANLVTQLNLMGGLVADAFRVLSTDHLRARTAASEARLQSHMSDLRDHLDSEPEQDDREKGESPNNEPAEAAAELRRLVDQAGQLQANVNGLFTSIEAFHSPLLLNLQRELANLQSLAIQAPGTEQIEACNEVSRLCLEMETVIIRGIDGVNTEPIWDELSQAIDNALVNVAARLREIHLLEIGAAD